MIPHHDESNESSIQRQLVKLTKLKEEISTQSGIITDTTSDKESMVILQSKCRRLTEKLGRLRLEVKSSEGLQAKFDDAIIVWSDALVGAHADLQIKNDEIEILTDKLASLSEPQHEAIAPEAVQRRFDESTAHRNLMNA